MNTAKARLAGIALLDRAFIHLSDDELATLIARLPGDHRTAIHRLAGMPDPVTSGDADDEAEADGASADAAVDPELVASVRSVAAKGRMNGDLERLAGVLTDPCLADCIEQLGENADLPSEEDLLEVTPGLVERHGLGVVRLMLAAVVVGEAPASPAIVRLLKHDETLALPAAAPAPAQIVTKSMTPEELAERERIKARRKEDRRQKQAEQAARRAQAADARRGGR